MKRLLLVLLISIPSISCFAQVTSLNEDFNGECPLGSPAPNDWLVYNPLPSYGTYGVWTCGASSGRSGSGGIACTALFGSPATNHVDTSIVVTPSLDLHSYSHVYMNFDSKTDIYHLGSKLEVLISADSTLGADTSALDTFTVYNRTTATMPLISSDDEANWVTHQIDLTDYKYVVPLYVGFRYTSDGGLYASKWFLDNIMTTTEELPNAVRDVNRGNKNIALTGNITGQHLLVQANVSRKGDYQLSVIDMSGHMVYKEQERLQTGSNELSITLPNQVAAGMYLIRIADNTSAATVRIATQ